MSKTDLAAKTVPELRKLALAAGVQLRPRATKQELLDALGTARRPVQRPAAKKPAKSTAPAAPARADLTFQPVPGAAGPARAAHAFDSDQLLGTVERSTMPDGTRAAWTFTGTDGRQGGPALYKADAVLAAYAEEA